MDEDIPEFGYLLPLDGRVSQAHVIGYFLGRLTYYFKVSYDGIQGSWSLLSDLQSSSRKYSRGFW